MAVCSQAAAVARDTHEAETSPNPYDRDAVAAGSQATEAASRIEDVRAAEADDVETAEADAVIAVPSAADEAGDATKAARTLIAVASEADEDEATEAVADSAAAADSNTPDAALDA